MTPEEWAALLPAAAERWPLSQVEDWYVHLADVDAGYVALALQQLGDSEVAPTPALVRRAVNAAVRQAAGEAPHPAASGLYTYSQWLERGVPGWPPDGRLLSREEARAEVEAIWRKPVGRQL